MQSWWRVHGLFLYLSILIKFKLFMANLSQPADGLNFYEMKDRIAKVISNDKVVGTRKHMEVQRICAESDELKALKAKIEAAYLNKERAGQMAESQFRAQRQVQEETEF